MGRTISASTVIPTTSAKPSCLREPSGLNKNDAKLQAVIAAAEVISPPVWPTARIIASPSSPAVRFLAEPGHQEHVVVHADGHEEDEKEIRHFPVDPRGAEDRDEEQMRRPQRESISQDHRGDQIEAGQRVAEGQEKDQEDTERHNIPALDLVRSDQGPDVSRLGVLPGDPGRHVEALEVAEELIGAAAEGLHLVHGGGRVDPVDLGQVDPGAAAVRCDIGSQAPAQLGMVADVSSLIMSRFSARRPTGSPSIDETSCRACAAPAAIRPAPSAARVNSSISTLRGSFDRATPSGLGDVATSGQQGTPPGLGFDASAARVVSDDPVSGIPVRSSSHSTARSLAAPSFKPF